MLNRLFLCKCSVVVLRQRENVSQTAAAESHWEDIIRLCREHLGSFIIITCVCCYFILMHVWNFLVYVVVCCSSLLQCLFPTTRGRWWGLKYGANFKQLFAGCSIFLILSFIFGWGKRSKPVCWKCSCEGKIPNTSGNERQEALANEKMSLDALHLSLIQQKNR